MCLILLAWKTHPDYPLILLANRDEHYTRPTAALHAWETKPIMYAGKDLEAGGTWLGATETGRFAAVTNIRDTQPVPEQARSRGHLVSHYLQNRQMPSNYLSGIESEQQHYQGFNLLVGTPKTLVYLNNRKGSSRLLTRGIYGLSNAAIDTQWPKVQESKVAFIRQISKREPDSESLFEIMRNTATYPDQLLPDTGVGPEAERQLSPIFIQGKDYGTRSSTLLMWNRQGQAQMIERSYDGEEHSDQKFEFLIRT